MTSDERFPYSRRAFVGAGGFGLVAAAAPAFAQSSKERPLSKQDEAPAPEALQDPRTKYPKPPFRRQEQPWPGLASKMDPRPDHGETSYRGSGRLAGRKALITGGDSGMGRAAAIAFAREGADVAINHLPAEEEDAREVIELMKAEGRTAVVDPRRYPRRSLLQAPCGGSGRRARRPRYPCQQRGTATDPRLDPRSFHRGF